MDERDEGVVEIARCPEVATSDAPGEKLVGDVAAQPAGTDGASVQIEVESVPGQRDFEGPGPRLEQNEALTLQRVHGLAKRPGRDEDIDVRAGAKVRLGVEGVLELGAFEHDMGDAGRLQGWEGVGEKLLPAENGRCDGEPAVGESFEECGGQSLG